MGKYINGRGTEEKGVQYLIIKEVGMVRGCVHYVFPSLFSSELWGVKSGKCSHIFRVLRKKKITLIQYVFVFGYMFSCIPTST